MFGVMKARIAVPILSLLAAMARADAGRGVVVETELHGVITEVSDPSLVLDDSVAPGTTFRCAYSFDPAQPDSSFSPYDGPDFGFYSFVRDPFGVSLQLGNYPFTSWSLQLRITNDALGMVGNDGFQLESGIFDALPPENPLTQIDGSSIRWTLNQCRYLSICPPDLPEMADLLSSDALLLVPPAIPSWSINEFQFVASSGWFCPPGDDYCVPDELFSVTGVVTSVPEPTPTAQSLVALVVLGLARHVRRRLLVHRDFVG